MEFILWILLGHYMLDYPLQGEFLATTKGKYWYSLFAHSMIYGLGMALIFYILGEFAMWKVAVLVLSHMAIDLKKATAENKDLALSWYLYLDQALHISISLFLFIS